MTNTPATKKKGFLPALLILLTGLALIAIGALTMRKEPPVDHGAPQQQVTEQATTPTSPAAREFIEKAEERAKAEAVPAAAPTGDFKPVVEPVGRTIGSKDAPIKITEYASLTCGHCAHFHNGVLDEFRVKYVDTGKVQITFREFPLNKPAMDASKLLNCLPEDQYYGFMSMLFQTQEHWAYTKDYMTTLKQSAKLAGMSDEKIESCLADAEMDKKIITGMQDAARKYEIQSTPTFIINDGAGKVTGAVPVAQFAKIIDPMLDGSAPATKPEEPKTDSLKEEPAQ